MGATAVAYAAALLWLAPYHIIRAVTTGSSSGCLSNAFASECATDLQLEDASTKTFAESPEENVGADLEAGIPAHFDLVVIGGGSGGIACARRAASYGASVAIVEKATIGGTCVNLGCMPKKVMWLAANLGDALDAMPHYGFSFPGSSLDAQVDALASEVPRNASRGGVAFSWEKLRESRDAYVSRLRNTFEKLLQEANIKVFRGTGKLEADVELPKTSQARRARERDQRHTVLIEDHRGGVTRVTAAHVLIATGTRRQILNVPGAEFAISSDGFFRIEHLPRRVAVVGSGYVSAELAGILRRLGVEVYVFMRGHRQLKSFDKETVERLEKIQIESGIRIYKGVNVVEISLAKADGTNILPAYTFERQNEGRESLGEACLTVHLDNGDAHYGFDQVIMAVSPAPSVEGIGLEEARVKVDVNTGGFIVVDKFQNTSVPGVYAVGDVTGKAMLAPAAVAAGRLLADRLFGGNRDAHHDLPFVPTVLFSQPALAAVGLTEEEAKARYGEENINVYKSTFVDSFYAAWSIPASEKPRSFVKMVCLKTAGDKVLGLHLLGRGAEEILQGFALAIKLGATKEDFNSCLAIHPTAAEEVVTLPDEKKTRTVAPKDSRL